jgi:hypothetical protein
MYRLSGKPADRPLRFGRLFVALCLVASNATTAEPVDRTTVEYSRGYFGGPVRGLTDVQLASFERGFALFVRNWKEGAKFAHNASSCVACHSVPMTGGAGMTDASFVHVDRLQAVGTRTEVVQSSIPPARLRAMSKQMELRRTPPLFGEGYLESAALTSGPGSGRFGAYLQSATIEDFVALAFANELGVSSSHYCARRSVEKPYPMRCRAVVTQDQIRDAANFIRYLAPPRSGVASPAAAAGASLFASIGCQMCHAQLRAAPTAAAPFGGATVPAYTDLKRHQLGSDERARVRTAPLWGINSFGPPYLHDARASSIEQSILMHEGEGASARARFLLLSVEQRAQLLAFVRSR